MSGRRPDDPVTPETIVYLLRAAGVDVATDGDRLVLRPASRVPPDLVPLLRARRAEVVEVVRRSLARPRPVIVATCVVCGQSCDASGSWDTWLRLLDGAWVPRCPACAAAARTRPARAARR